MNNTDTIFALSSGAGKSGVAVIRISGNDLLETAQKFINKKNITPRHAYFTNLTDENNELIDQCLIICAAPVEGDVRPLRDGRCGRTQAGRNNFRDDAQLRKQHFNPALHPFLPSNATPFSLPRGIIALRSKGASLHSNSASLHACANAAAFFIPVQHRFFLPAGNRCHRSL